MGDLRHVARELTERNMVWGCDPHVPPLALVSQMKACARQQRAAFRKGASVGLELLVWGTREAWELGGDRLQAVFSERIKKMVERLFGEGSVAAIRIDHDEPNGNMHGSAFVVPVTETRTKTGKVKRAVSTKRALHGCSKTTLKQRGSEIQDVAHETFQDFGMFRGIPSDRKHIPPREFRRIQEWEHAIEGRDAAADYKLDMADALRIEVEAAHIQNARFSDSVRQLELATNERLAEANLALSAAESHIARAREAEAAAAEAKKRAEAAEHATKLEKQALREREAKIAEAERETNERLVAIQLGVDAWMDSQAFPLPKPGQWTIKSNIPAARRSALQGKYGIQIWRWVAVEMKRQVSKLEASFDRLGLSDVVRMAADNPIWKRIRSLEPTEHLMPVPSVASETPRILFRP